MKATGWLMLISGVALLVYGLGMDTTTGGYLDGDRVHNLGLLSNRLVVTIQGGFLLSTGILLLGLDAIRGALTSTRPPEPLSRGAQAEDVAPFELAPGSHPIGNCVACKAPVTEENAHRLKFRLYCDTCFQRALR